MKSILMMWLVLYALGSHAQTATQSLQNNIDRIADSGITTSELMMGLPPPMPRVLGSVYFRDSTWHLAEIRLKANKRNYKNISVRFNFYNNQLEIATGKDIRALDAKLIESFIWLNPKGAKQEFILMSNLKAGEGNYSGIGEVLYSKDSRKLLVHHYIVLQEPDYLPQFDVGSRDKKILEKSDLLFIESNNVTKLKPSVKFLSATFKVNRVHVKDYIKDNDLTLSDKDDLAKVASHFIDSIH